MSESYPMTLAFPAEDEGPSAMKLTVNQPGLVITAGGSATETKYDFTAPTVSVVLDEIKDQAGTVLDTKADLVLTGSTASYLVATAGDATQLDSSFAAGSLALNVSGASPESGESGTVTVSFSDLKGPTKGNLLGAEMMANMAAALNSGFTTDTSMSFGAMTLTADITDSTGPTAIKGSATGGGFVLASRQDAHQLRHIADGREVHRVGRRDSVSRGGHRLCRKRVQRADPGFEIRRRRRILPS